MQTISSMYTRTAQGRYTAFNATNSLPTALKTLLQAVDGKTVSSVLAHQLANLGSVPELLVQLENAGLIEDKNTTERSSGFDQHADSSGYCASGLLDLNDGQWGFTGRPSYQAHTGLAPLHLVAPAPLGHPSQGAGAAAYGKPSHWAATAAGGLDELPALSLESLLANQIQNIADTMATFVLTHLPSQAYSMLKELESLRSPSQLMATLPSYALMARTAGIAGRQHVVELNRLIDEQFQSSV